MSTSDFLFQSTAPSAWTSPSWTNQSSPEWWQAASQALIGRASNIAGQDYQTYSGPRIAGFDPLQQQAMSTAGNYIPGVNNELGDAKNLAGSASQLFNQPDFNKFMSPYTTGVVDRIAELGGRNLSENLLPAVNDTFIRAGQFGGSRNADFTARALRDTNESVLGQQANALESAQKNAMGDYQNAQNRQLQGAQVTGALGQITGTESRNQLENLNKFGIQGQGQSQANLDLAAKDFENQVNYPQKQLEMLNSILKGYQSNLPQTQTRYSADSFGGSQATPLQGIAGVLSGWGGQQK